MAVTVKGHGGCSSVHGCDADVLDVYDDAELEWWPRRPLEGQRAEFHCTIRLEMTRVENVSWFLDSALLSDDVNHRVRITTEPQPRGAGQWRSTLVLSPAHYSDSGKHFTSATF